MMLLFSLLFVDIFQVARNSEAVARYGLKVGRPLGFLECNLMDKLLPS